MTQHEAAFGKDCLPCHDGSSNAKVDHSKFPFKLTGKHAGLPCSACHGSAKSIQDFQKTPQDCYSCHARGSNTQLAARHEVRHACHTTAGWTGATFDHSVFPVDHGSNQQKA